MIEDLSGRSNELVGGEDYCIQIDPPHYKAYLEEKIKELRDCLTPDPSRGKFLDMDTEIMYKIALEHYISEYKKLMGLR